MLNEWFQDKSAGLFAPTPVLVVLLTFGLWVVAEHTYGIIACPSGDYSIFYGCS